MFPLHVSIINYKYTVVFINYFTSFYFSQSLPHPPLTYLSHFNFEFIVYIPPRIIDPENVIT